MRGSPLQRALLLLVALLALCVPLKRITRTEASGGTPDPPADRPSETGDAPVQKLGLLLSFTKGAERVELRHLGQPVWSKDHPGLQETADFSLPFPKEGIELAVSVRWPGEDLSAVRVRLTTPEGSELERSVWGGATVEAVLSFP